MWYGTKATDVSPWYGVYNAPHDLSIWMGYGLYCHVKFGGLMRYRTLGRKGIKSLDS
jgi:hypothetical protein